MMFNTVSGFLLATSGVGVDPGSGTVDLQRTTVEHLGETCTHLQIAGENINSRDDEWNRKYGE